MGCQALSGIAKDLTKMSAKSAVKVLVPKGDDSALFKWVAVLTGSKNALKGAGFFLGGFLLSVLGFRGALSVMATGVLIVLSAGHGLSAGGDRAGEEEGRVRGHSLQLEAASTACRWRGSHCSLRGTCGLSSAFPSSWRACLAGRFAQVGGVHGAMGHCLWRRAECFSCCCSPRRLAERRQGPCSRARSASASLRSPP